MRRREFIAGLGGAAAWPVVARGQQPGEQEEAIYLGALRQGLNELGYIEGKNIQLLNRFAAEHYDRFDALATELVEAKVDVIVAVVAPALLAAKKSTKQIPIIFVGLSDPVGQHIVDSLAHPGGNLTGLSAMFTDLTGKQLEILKDCLPALSSSVLLVNPTNTVNHLLVDNAQSASRVANIELSIVEAEKPNDLRQAFLDIARKKASAVIIPADGMFYKEREQVAELAIAHNLATIGPVREMAEAGLLLSYGPEFSDLFRRTGVYIDKILKGTKPGDIPVELPTRFDLVVNMATARAIGATVPDTTQLLANKIIG